MKMCATIVAATIATQLVMLAFASSSVESIATGRGRNIYRPARSTQSEQHTNVDDANMLLAMKRSMSLGRLSFRPGKRRFLPMNGAFAHDPQNRRFELLLMNEHPESINWEEPSEEVEEDGQIQSKVLVNRILFDLLPRETTETQQEEFGIGKRSVASGRFGFRPAKRSMAVGRTGFRPGKRSIATGRLKFRPGKRSESENGNSNQQHTEANVAEIFSP